VDIAKADNGTLNISSIGQIDEHWDDRQKKARDAPAIPPPVSTPHSPQGGKSGSWKQGTKQKANPAQMQRQMSKRGDQIADTFGKGGGQASSHQRARRRKSSVAKMGLPGGLLAVVAQMPVKKDLGSLLSDAKKKAVVNKKAAAAEKRQLRKDGVEGVEKLHGSVKGVVPDNLRRGSEGALRFMVETVDNTNAPGSAGGSAKSRWGAAIKKVMKVQVMQTSVMAENKVKEQKLAIARKMRMHRRLIDQPECLSQPYEKVWVQSGAEYLSLSTKSVKEVFNKSLMQAERVKMLRAMGLGCLIESVREVEMGAGTTFIRENDTKSKLVYILEEGSCMMYSDAHLPADEKEAANAAIKQEENASKEVEISRKASIVALSKAGEHPEEDANDNGGGRRLSTRDAQLQLLQMKQQQEVGPRRLPASAPTAECKAARQNMQRKLAVLGCQCIMGEISALLQVPQPTSVRTVSSCKFLVVDVPVFTRDVKSNWQIAASLKEAAGAKQEMIEELKEKPYPLERPTLQTEQEEREEELKMSEGRASALRLSDRSSLQHAVRATAPGPADYKKSTATDYYNSQKVSESGADWRPHGNITSKRPVSVYTRSNGLIQGNTSNDSMRRALQKRADEQSRPPVEKVEEVEHFPAATTSDFIHQDQEPDQELATTPSPWGLALSPSPPTRSLMSDPPPAPSTFTPVQITSSVMISSFTSGVGSDAHDPFDVMTNKHQRSPSTTSTSLPELAPFSQGPYVTPRLADDSDDAPLSQRSSTSSFLMSARSAVSNRTPRSTMTTPRLAEPQRYILHGKSSVLTGPPVSPPQQRRRLPSLLPVGSISNPTAAPRPTHKFDIWNAPRTSEYRYPNTGSVNVVGVGRRTNAAGSRVASSSPTKFGRASTAGSPIITTSVTQHAFAMGTKKLPRVTNNTKPTALLQAINVKSGMSMF
jgi:hypothetical protein